MSEKFKNKFRNGTFRAQWWDYGWNGAYFITICTQNREHFFGEIENGMMTLSHTGVIATILWNEIPKHHDFVELGDFVVMPNHVHGILIIDKPNADNPIDGFVVESGPGFVDSGSGFVGSGSGFVDSGSGFVGSGSGFVGSGSGFVDSGSGFVVGSGHALNLQQPPALNQPKTPGEQRFQNIGKNTISSIVGSYKSAVSKYANRMGFPNGWQRLYYDNIIRTDADYQRISDYIVANPENWSKDKFFEKEL